ncbi:MAG: ankyrin repeat domain-containing protein, partial [Lentimonas sp.]
MLKRTVVYSLLLSLWLGCVSFADEVTIDKAIAKGEIAVVREIVAANPAAANQGKHPKLTPLHQAILRKQVEIAVFLIESGADVNRPDSSKRTPLHLCVDRDLPKVA